MEDNGSGEDAGDRKTSKEAGTGPRRERVVAWSGDRKGPKGDSEGRDKTWGAQSTRRQESQVHPAVWGRGQAGEALTEVKVC